MLSHTEKNFHPNKLQLKWQNMTEQTKNCNVMENSEMLLQRPHLIRNKLKNVAPQTPKVTKKCKIFTHKNKDAFMQ